MKYVHLLVAASTLLAVPAAAQASAKTADKGMNGAPVATTAEVPAVAPNAMIFSADGRRIGRVDHIRTVNGAPFSASVVFAGHYVNVPVSTLSPKDGGFVSTLKTADIIGR